MTFLFLLLSFTLQAGCGETAAPEGEDAQVIFRYYHSGVGDARLLDENYILTTRDRKLIGIDIEKGKIRRYNIEADWLDVDQESGTVLYTNAAFQLGAVRLDENRNIIHNEILYSNQESDYMIDPSVLKLGDSYYISLTFANGTLNNSSPEKKNGKYSIRFFKSEDLKSVTYLSDVVSENRNLEDVKLASDGEKLLLMFEKETVDQGYSNLQICVSEDKGLSWNSPISLFELNADYEPASLIRNGDGWDVFYSSDLENPGQSYNGALFYRAGLSDDLEIKTLNERVILARESSSRGQSPEYAQKGGILGYDVQMFDGKVYYLYAENHATDDNLCVSVSVK
ncbi:MAG: hypothetical protein K6E30_01120 [Lachnospiraceae bacterium]|nr:hypothetical protein [Lachnospiraceae bacterium]